jgi:hypothetical protein
MINSVTRNAFEAMTLAGVGDAGALAVGLRREVTSVGLRALAAKMLHVAVAAPERMVDVYDNAAAGWSGGAVFPPRGHAEPPLKPGEGFWTAFWKLMETPYEQRRKLGFTLQTAQLAGLLPGELNARAAGAVAEFRGVGEAAAGGVPPKFDLERLARCPGGSVGGAFYRDVLANGGSLELIDRQVLELDRLPPPLAYVNARILQSHGLWAIVGGYSPAMLDEIALAAFQMGQFGHPYSALLVGIVMAALALDRPPGIEFMLDAIFRGWTHGRATAPLLGVAWEEIWDLPVDSVRAKLGVTPFDSPLAAAASRFPNLPTTA